MRAAYCQEHGSPELLEVAELDDPRPGEGQVLVRIAAAAVNFPDVLIVANQYQIQVPTPFIPGSEFAGEVVEIGPGVSALAVGDWVFGSTMVGAFAESIAVPEQSLTRVPDGVELTTAASFRVAYATAYHALRSVAEVTPGDVVLVLGAAGGVGLAAVELAGVLGATVIAAASTDEKLEVCRSKGATHSVNYETSDLRGALRELAPDGVDVVIDPVGGAYSEPALRGTGWGGRFVTIGFASGEIPSIPLNLVLLKGVIVKGFEMRSFSEHAPDLAERDGRDLMGLLAAGSIDPHICATFALEDAAAALRFVADRRATGKVLVIP